MMTPCYFCGSTLQNQIMHLQLLICAENHCNLSVRKVLPDFITRTCFFPEVWKISVQGPCYMTVLMIAFGLLWGHLLQIRPTQSVFISTCLSLSSTPLVSRFLAGSVRGDKEGKCDFKYGLL